MPSALQHSVRPHQRSSLSKYDQCERARACSLSHITDHAWLISACCHLPGAGTHARPRHATKTTKTTTADAPQASCSQLAMSKHVLGITSPHHVLLGFCS
uniref:Uncharacterized protein n=1 Tax=Knipowitschia caucasica TaxID=637954 RepID=A0AAV2J877_KNICA